MRTMLIFQSSKPLSKAELVCGAQTGHKGMGDVQSVM